MLTCGLALFFALVNVALASEVVSEAPDLKGTVLVPTSPMSSMGKVVLSLLRPAAELDQYTALSSLAPMEQLAHLYSLNPKFLSPLNELGPDHYRLIAMAPQAGNSAIGTIEAFIWNALRFVTDQALQPKTKAFMLAAMLQSTTTEIKRQFLAKGVGLTIWYYGFKISLVQAVIMGLLAAATPECILANDSAAYCIYHLGKRALRDQAINWNALQLDTSTQSDLASWDSSLVVPWQGRFLEIMLANKTKAGDTIKSIPNAVAIKYIPATLVDHDCFALSLAVYKREHVDDRAEAMCELARSVFVGLLTAKFPESPEVLSPSPRSIGKAAAGQNAWFGSNSTASSPAAVISSLTSKRRNQPSIDSTKDSSETVELKRFNLRTANIMDMLLEQRMRDRRTEATSLSQLFSNLVDAVSICQAVRISSFHEGFVLHTWLLANENNSPEFLSIDPATVDGTFILGHLLYLACDFGSSVLFAWLLEKFPGTNVGRILLEFPSKPRNFAQFMKLIPVPDSQETIDCDQRALHACRMMAAPEIDSSCSELTLHQMWGYLQAQAVQQEDDVDVLLPWMEAIVKARAKQTTGELPLIFESSYALERLLLTCPELFIINADIIDIDRDTLHSESALLLQPLFVAPPGAHDALLVEVLQFKELVGALSRNQHAVDLLFSRCSSRIVEYLRPHDIIVLTELFHCHDGNCLPTTITQDQVRDAYWRAIKSPDQLMDLFSPEPQPPRFLTLALRALYYHRQHLLSLFAPPTLFLLLHNAGLSNFGTKAFIERMKAESRPRFYEDLHQPWIDRTCTWAYAEDTHLEASVDWANISETAMLNMPNHDGSCILS